jgi:hypothetical protein
MRLATIIGIALFALLVGLGVGFYFGSTVAKSAGEMGDEIADITYHATLLEVQRNNGTDAAYEEALLAYLAFLERRKGEPGLILSERAHAADTALTYARLSALATRRGAVEQASQYLASASAVCPRLGWRECSGEAIVAAVERLDDQRWSGPANAN